MPVYPKMECDLTGMRKANFCSNKTKRVKTNYCEVNFQLERLTFGLSKGNWRFELWKKAMFLV